MRKIVSIILLALAFLVAFYYLLFFPLYSIFFRPELFREERKYFENYMLERGYRICGEVQLPYGRPSIVKYSEIFRGETKCVIFFNLPEPKGEYVVYDPVFEVKLIPVNQEDMNKTYKYHIVPGGPGLVIYELTATPFQHTGRGVSGGISFYYELFKRGQRGVDLFVVFSYKPLELEDMPINVTIVVDAFILKVGEKFVPPTHPKEPETSEEWISLTREVDIWLRKLGYEDCGEYVLDPGRRMLNLTYIFDPFEGKACYIKLMPGDPAKQKVVINKAMHSRHPADRRQITGILEIIERGPVDYTDPHSMLYLLNPDLYRYSRTLFPGPYEGEGAHKGVYDSFPEGSGIFGPVEGRVIYILFAWKLSPNSRIDEGMGFKVVYNLTIDLEVVEEYGVRSFAVG